MPLTLTLRAVCGGLSYVLLEEGDLEEDTSLKRAQKAAFDRYNQSAAALRHEIATKFQSHEDWLREVCMARQCQVSTAFSALWTGCRSAGLPAPQIAMPDPLNPKTKDYFFYRMIIRHPENSDIRRWWDSTWASKPAAPLAAGAPADV